MFNLICNKVLSIEIHDIEVHEYPYRQPCSQYFGNPLNCNLGSTLRISILFNFYTKIGKNVCSAWLNPICHGPLGRNSNYEKKMVWAL